MCDSASLVALLDGAVAIEPCLAAVETVRAHVTEGLPAAHERVVYRALAAALGRIATAASTAGANGDWSAYCDTVDAIRTTTFCDPAPACTEWSGRAFLCKALATLSLPQSEGAVLSEAAFESLYDCVAAVANAPESSTRTPQEIRVAQNTLPSICSALASKAAAVAVLARRGQDGDAAARDRLSALASSGVAEAKQHLVAAEESVHAAKLFARDSDGSAITAAVAFFAPSGKSHHGKGHADAPAAVTSNGIVAVEAAAKALSECALSSSSTHGDDDGAANHKAGDAAIDAAIYASNVLEVLVMCRPSCLRGEHATNKSLDAATSLIASIQAIWTALTASPETIATGLGGPDAATALLFTTQQWVMMLPHHPTKRIATGAVINYDDSTWASFTAALGDLLRSMASVCIPEAPAAECDPAAADVSASPVEDAAEDDVAAAAAANHDDDVKPDDAAAAADAAKPSPSPMATWAAALNPLLVELQLEVLLNATLVSNDVLRAGTGDADSDSAAVSFAVSATTLRAIVAAFEPAAVALADYVANTAESGGRRRDEGRKHGRGHRDHHRRGRGQQSSELKGSSDLASQRLTIVQSVVCRAKALLSALEVTAPAATSGYKLAHSPSWRA